MSESLDNPLRVLHRLEREVPKHKTWGLLINCDDGGAKRLSCAECPWLDESHVANNSYCLLQNALHHKDEKSYIEFVVRLGKQVLGEGNE